MKEQPQLVVEEVATETLIPYAHNAKIHTNEQVDQIVKSIEEFGFNDPIAVWDNPEGETEIIEGHGRVLAATKLGMDKLPIVRLNHLSDEQRRAYTHVHNQLTMNTDWDLQTLEFDLQELDFNFEDFGFVLLDEDETLEDDGLRDDYSQNVGKVVYEPKETNWSPSDLYELERQDLEELIAKVEDNDLRKMLEIRKDWFCDFKFAKIADDYAYQASKDEQRVFEALGLVLLDKDGLIANGFAALVDNV